MTAVGVLAGLALIVLVLLDGFEAMVLPRRVTRNLRPARLYYRLTWSGWRLLARLLRGRRQATFLSYFGPLSLLGLFVVWVAGLIVGFALVNWSLQTTTKPGELHTDFPTHLYFSGATFLTLGPGDIVPVTPAGRGLAVLEAGMGFGFMAVIIGYLPVLFQAFSHREVTISLLDARAGSPPSAAELLARLGGARGEAAVGLLAEWERWSAEVLESHLSFPQLAYYRSQHDNQSWLAALTVTLDACSVVLAGLKVSDIYQAQLTFAMARHAVVDIALVFHSAPGQCGPLPDRLPPEALARLRARLAEVGLLLPEGPAVDAKLSELRGMYEPFVHALSRHFLVELPPFVPEKAAVDNWQTSAWMRRVPGLRHLPQRDSDDHFD
jgi:hypothetical protein